MFVCSDTVGWMTGTTFEHYVVITMLQQFTQGYVTFGHPCLGAGCFGSMSVAPYWN